MRNYIALLLCLAMFKAIAQPAVNDTVNDFTIVDIHGQSHHLYSYLEEGKYVCIDFFGTTCDQCQELVPVLSHVYQSYGCNQSQVVFLAIDLLHFDGELEIFEEEYGGIYPMISGKNGGGEQVYHDWQIQYWPQLVLINPDKVLVSNMHPINPIIIDSVFSSHQILLDSCDANGIEDHLLNQKNIAVSPNPAKDMLYIDLHKLPISEIEYKLYNSRGNMLSKGCCETHFSLDVSNYATGLYVIEISNNNSSYHQKIMIY